MEIVVRSDHSEHAMLPAFPPLMDAVCLLCSSRIRIHVRRTVSHRFALIRASPTARSLARRRSVRESPQASEAASAAAELGLTPLRTRPARSRRSRPRTALATGEKRTVL